MDTNEPSGRSSIMRQKRPAIVNDDAPFKDDEDEFDNLIQESAHRGRATTNQVDSKKNLLSTTESRYP